MYTPWFSGTDDSARSILRSGQDDYLQFIELTGNTSPAPNWHTKVLISFADLLIASGTKIKKSAAPKLRTSFQAR